MAIVPDMTMGEGDSETLRWQLKNRDGTAMNLTGRTVTVKFKKITEDPPATEVDVNPDPDQTANTGYVDFAPFEPGDSTPGLYEVRFKVVVTSTGDRISVRNYHPHLLLEVTSDPS